MPARRRDPVRAFLDALFASGGRLSRDAAQSRFGSYADTAVEEGLAREYDDGFEVFAAPGYQGRRGTVRLVGYEITQAGRAAR